MKEILIKIYITMSKERVKEIVNMNYYSPNYYSGINYPYSNYPLPAQQQPLPQPVNPMQQQNNMNPALNGKIVDSEDVVKATEVPIGGYGIFPKADLSEIYIKSWNNNGTTSIITFKPTVQEEPSVIPQQISNDEISKVLQKIELLENKLDMLLPQQVQIIPEKQQQKAKEVPKSGF